MPGQPLCHDKLQAKSKHAYSSDPNAWSFRVRKYAGIPIVSVPEAYLEATRRHCKILPIVFRCANELERRRRIGSNRYQGNIPVE